MKGQSWNAAAVSLFGSIISRPSLCIPQLQAPTIASIDWQSLRNGDNKAQRWPMKIKAVCFDKDNTLTAPFATRIHPPFESAWKECIAVFGGENIVLVSNSAGGPDDRDGIEAAAIETALGVRVLRHGEKKPRGAETLLAHFVGLKPAEIAVVGDRVLTDVVYGNSIGAFTILTRDIVTREGDNRVASAVRRIENWVVLPLLTTVFGVKAVPPSDKL